MSIKKVNPKVWRELCDSYVLAFCEKHGYDVEYELQQGYLWVGNDPGTVASIGDMFVNMDDIRYDLDHDVPEEMFEKWYWESLDRYELGVRYMNYPSFCKGCQDPISEDKLDAIKEAKKNLDEAALLFEDAVHGYELDVPDKIKQFTKALSDAISEQEDGK